MKILFQGGFKEKAGNGHKKAEILGYIDEFAKQLVQTNHQVVLTDDWEYDNMVAEKTLAYLGGDTKAARRHVIYYMPSRVESVPSIGMVKKYKTPKYWTNERTMQTQFSDCLMVIGGERGTGDCMEKFFLSNKPVFIAYSASDYPSKVWDDNGENYFYLQNGDADFITDLNQTPMEFFEEVFRIINLLEAKENPHHNKDQSAKPSTKINDIRGWVAEGLIDKAFKELMNASKNIDTGLSNQIIILAGQYRRNERNKNLGLGEKSEEEARIMFAVLSVLDELESNQIMLE